MALFALAAAIGVFATDASGWRRGFGGVLFLLFVVLFVSHWRRWGYARFSN